MSDRESGLGWHMGGLVKNVCKDVMETCCGEYGFILYWPKCKMHCKKEVTSWINVSCAMGILCLQCIGYFFVVVCSERKRENKENAKQVICCTTALGVIYSLRWYV